MRHFIIVFLSLIFLISCKPEIKDEIIELHPDGSMKKQQFYTFKRGKKDIVREVEYYSNGNVLMEGNIKNNQRVGEWKSFHQDGELWSIGYYEEGKRVGKSEVFFENGQKRIEGNYESGNRIGKWIFYNMDGEKVKEVDFAADTIVSQKDYFEGIPFTD